LLSQHFFAQTSTFIPRASRRSCDPAQRRRHATPRARIGWNPILRNQKYQFPIDLVELLVCARSDEVGFNDAITRTDRVLRFFDGECARTQERGRMTNPRLPLPFFSTCRDQHGLYSRRLHKRDSSRVLLRNSPALITRPNRAAIFRHAFQNDAGVKSSAFKGAKSSSCGVSSYSSQK